jgi:ATP-dependent protease ClpP protease subunit
MKGLLVLVSLLFLVSTTAIAATPVPITVAPTPLQSLPPPGSKSQTPKLSPEMEKLFTPIERVTGASPAVTNQPKPSAPDKEQPNPCDEQKGHDCVVALRLAGTIDDRTKIELGVFLTMAKKWGAKIVMLEITTDGGLYPQGHDMARMIELFPGSVVCVGDSTVASMGVYILEACDRRLITKRTTLMVHQVLAPVSEVYLNAPQLHARAKAAEAYTTIYFEQVVAKTKLSLVELRKKVGSREWYINSDEALKLGFVDAVVDVPPNKIFTMLKAGMRP